jgi:hypothetical protein
MTVFNDYSVYVQQARNALAIINRSWDGQNQHTAVVAFEIAVVGLRAITDTASASSWVATTVDNVSALLV